MRRQAGEEQPFFDALRRDFNVRGLAADTDAALRRLCPLYDDDAITMLLVS